MRNIYKIYGLIFLILIIQTVAAQSKNTLDYNISATVDYSFYNPSTILFNATKDKTLESPLRRAEIIFFLSLAFSLTYTYAIGTILPSLTLQHSIKSGPLFKWSYLYIGVNSVIWATAISVHDYKTVKEKELEFTLFQKRIFK